jgi:hypothetical protein
VADHAPITDPENHVWTTHERWEQSPLQAGGVSLAIRDALGVDWHVAELSDHGPGGGVVLTATVAKTSERTYVPAPALGIELAAGTPTDRAMEAALAVTGEYAAIHADEIALLVKGGDVADVPWWVWGLLGLAVFSRKR